MKGSDDGVGPGEADLISFVTTPPWATTACFPFCSHQIITRPLSGPIQYNALVPTPPARMRFQSRYLPTRQPPLLPYLIHPPPPPNPLSALLKVRPTTTLHLHGKRRV
jgi:hypothetical protein